MLGAQNCDNARTQIEGRDGDERMIAKRDCA